MDVKHNGHTLDFTLLVVDSRKCRSSPGPEKYNIYLFFPPSDYMSKARKPLEILCFEIPCRLYIEFQYLIIVPSLKISLIHI